MIGGGGGGEGGHSTSAFYSVILGYSRKYPHTSMDDIGNPVRNAQ